MKCKLFILFIVAIFSVQSSNASHVMGGEITWRCLPTGEFIFKMIFYRDCNGIAFSGSPISLNVDNHSIINSIPLTLTEQNDISPNGCSNCIAGGPGAVEEYIYESMPITLTGIPPSNGWIFHWSTNSRSLSITNLVNPGTLGIRIKAVMYPYNIMNTNLAYDSSPQFLQNPKTIFCVGQSIQYSSAVHDPDGDSLVYSWGIPTSHNGNILLYNYTPGYSHTSPLPGPIQDSNNVAAILNPQTGLIIFTSFTAGSFVTVVNVKSYKCGQLVAEIDRDINIILSANCNTLPNGLANTEPEITSPFQDSSGNFTINSDTIMVGDSVLFTIEAADFELDSIGPQLVTLYGSSAVFPDSIFLPAACASPPCASVNNTFPIGPSVAAVTVTINWISNCNQLIGSSTCVVTNRQVDFEFTAQDNFCPAPGSVAKIVSVIVKDHEPVGTPFLDSLTQLPNGDVTIHWTPPIDKDSTFDFYCIYYSNFNTGPYVIIDSVTNINQTMYTHIGAMGSSTVDFYKISTKSSNLCNAYIESPLSGWVYNYDSTGPDNNALLPISIYPNPAHDILHINSELFLQEKVSIEIRNSLGQLMFDNTIHTEKTDVNVKEYMAGIYIVTFISEKIPAINIKFTKQ